jgi:hypothetical protein
MELGATSMDASTDPVEMTESITTSPVARKSNLLPRAIHSGTPTPPAFLPDCAAIPLLAGSLLGN